MTARRHACALRLLLGRSVTIGPGKADLLAALVETGSISAAARSMGMSYKKAWYLLDTMNRCFRAPLIKAEKGGRSRGGARLTPTGERALGLYRAIEDRAIAAAADELGPSPSSLSTTPTPEPSAGLHPSPTLDIGQLLYRGSSMTEHACTAASPPPVAAFLSGALIGTLGGLIGLGGAEFRLPLLIGAFRFAALEAVILNKAISLVVVATALPLRTPAVPFAMLAMHWTAIANLLAGSLAGAWFGASWATRLRSATLHRVIAVLLVGIGGLKGIPRGDLDVVGWAWLSPRCGG